MTAPETPAQNRPPKGEPYVSSQVVRNNSNWRTYAYLRGPRHVGRYKHETCMEEHYENDPGFDCGEQLARRACDGAAITTLYRHRPRRRGQPAWPAVRNFQ